jgi:hypothetical protein
MTRTTSKPKEDPSSKTKWPAFRCSGKEINITQLFKHTKRKIAWDTQNAV